LAKAQSIVYQFRSLKATANQKNSHQSKIYTDQFFVKVFILCSI